MNRVFKISYNIMKSFLSFAVQKTNKEINITTEIKTNLRRVEKKRMDEVRIRLFTLRSRASQYTLFYVLL